jgi:hypothetical protein
MRFGSCDCASIPSMPAITWSGRGIRGSRSMADWRNIWAPSCSICGTQRGVLAQMLQPPPGFH